jgi:alkyl hydroperoxide reductase subunit AhpC
MIGDLDPSISKAWSLLPATAEWHASKRMAADNQSVHNVFAIGPGEKTKRILVYPMRRSNFDELLRVNDSTELTAKHKVELELGGELVIAGTVTDDATRSGTRNGWQAVML